MPFSGKILFHVGARLTPRFWVPHLLRIVTIRHYSRLFAIIRTIRTIRFSGFADTRAFTCDGHFNIIIQNSKQSLETKPPQFYKVSQSLELVGIVIVINDVIGGFSGEDLR